MPVINLPQDTRWGDLGKGLGTVLAAGAGAYAQNQVQAGVAEIMQDPSLSEQDKGVQALKKFGKPGYETYNKLVETQVLQGQLKDVLAQAGLRTVQTEQAKKNLGYSDEEFAAKIAQTKAQTGNVQSQTTARNVLLPGEVAQQGASTANVQSQTTSRNALLPGEVMAQSDKSATTSAALPGVAAESELASTKAQQAVIQLDRLRQMGASTPTGLNAIMDAAGIPQGHAVRALATSSYNAETDPVKAMEKFNSTLSNFVNTKTNAEIRANVPKSLSEAEIKESANQAQFATSSQRFLDAVKDRPDELGLLTGAPIRAWMERHGLATGDQTLLNAMESQAQIVASSATQGGGFFAQGRVALAKDIAPSISRTPMANLIALDTIADREIASLTRRIDAQTPNVKTKPLDDSLQQWKDIKATTSSLQSYVANGDKTVVMFNNNQVDPKTFKPILRGDTKLKAEANNAEYTGAQVLQVAKEMKMTPQEFVAKYGLK